MAAHLRQTFSDKDAKNEPVFVTFLTAGFPTVADTVPLLLSLEKGGADVIELGVPFSDPQADGPAIQHSDEVALANGVTLPSCLDLVSQARKAGLTVPVLLMGYYNPILAYGEKKLVQDARAAGASGFIIVDLPPEDAFDFRGACTTEGLSFIPLVAPATTDKRIGTLLHLADSFIYVVSKNGTTGATSNVSSTLEPLVERIRKVQAVEDVHVPLAVGFGVSTHQHFTEVGSVSDGVVIGSQLIKIIGSTPEGQRAAAAQKFCEEITNKPNGFWHRSKPLPTISVSSSEKRVVSAKGQDKRPGWFGGFGGQYIPEALYQAHAELEKAYLAAVNDPSFWKEFESYFDYMGRPSDLYFADRLTEAAGGARIWLKREDLNHTGSHKINNVVGQMILAKRLGKTRIIAETGAGQHGVATATVAAKFGLKCVVYMGAEDVRRQQLNAYRMKMLGADVVAVEAGSKTLKDAINEANRDWVTNIENTHYVVGSAIGPHPFPSMVRDFQSIIGKEVRKQLQAKRGKLPDAVVACVGGGSNAIGIFHTFIPDKSVRLIGVEAGGDGVDTSRHSATLSKGKPGVLHGVRTYLLQNKDGQITETHSISAGLDYSGIGPEHAWLKDSARADYRVATDAQALEGFRLLTQLEGIIPALESSHAIYGGFQEAAKLPKDQDVVISLSGNGAKDVPEVISLLTERGWDQKVDWFLDGQK